MQGNSYPGDFASWCKCAHEPVKKHSHVLLNSSVVHAGAFSCVHYLQKTHKSKLAEK